MSVSSLQSLIQLFFTDRLLKQLGASPYTVAAYRDAFRLLLQFGCNALDARHPNCAWKISMLPSWGSSSNTSNSTAATAPGRETTVWRQYTPSSNTWRSANQLWPCSANASSRSLRSAMSAARWSS